MTHNRLKRALVLAGGGMRLAYQAGVIQALEEEGLGFDHVDGTSGGIFNTAMMACGQTPSAMASRWRALNPGDFMSLYNVGTYLRPARIPAMASLEGIRKKVFPALGIDIDQIRANDQLTATFNVCNFSGKKVESVPQDQVTEDHLAAGVSLPMVMPAVRIGQDWYTDAVWIKDANLTEAVKRGADEIWLVWAIGHTREYLPGLFNQYVHMIEMSAGGGLLLEFEQLEALNERISRGDSPYGQKRPVVVHIIKPTYPLPLDPDLFFDRIDAATLINMGYADSKAYLAAPHPDTKPGSDSTLMADPGTCFSFRQQYTGRLKLEGEPVAVTYQAAFQLRQWASTGKLTLYAAICIRPFGGFIPTFDNEARLLKAGHRQVIHCSSSFLHHGQLYRINAEMQLGVMADWLLGLEFKTVSLRVCEVNAGLEGPVLLAGSLQQSTEQRLRNAMAANLRNYTGKNWKIMEKLRMIKRLYRYEV